MLETSIQTYEKVMVMWGNAKLKRIVVRRMVCELL